MKRIIAVLALMSALWWSTAAECIEDHILLRNSVDQSWNVGWGQRLVFPKPAQTLRNTTVANPELWWNFASSKEVSFWATLKYHYLQFTLRDSSLTPGLFRLQKALDVRLNYYTVGGAIQLKLLPLTPYVCASVGYCRGALTNVYVNENIPEQTKKYLLVDGLGGGFFVDIGVGGRLWEWNRIGMYFEARYLFSADWADFRADELWGDTDPRFVIGYAMTERDIRVQGPHVALGLEVRL